MKLAQSRRPHFIGIGGVGMCALAEMMIHDGLDVSGCDSAPSERTRRLAGLGATISIGHDPAHLDNADLVVMTAAIAGDNPELRAAKALGIPVLRRSKALGELMHGRLGVAVAGTHGKTTTTAMIGQVLEGCGMDPSVLAGGRMQWVNAHTRVGRGEVVVCEADEFDRAFLDLNAHYAVVTNVEAEHLECYGSDLELRRAFVEFASRVPESGSVLLCSDDEGARRLAEQLTDTRIVRYGLGAEAELRAVDIEEGSRGFRCRIERGGDSLGVLELPMPGLHNLRNCLAAVAVGLEFGLAYEDIAAVCGRFEGVARRFEYRGERDSVIVIDDYAHHPTEIASVLAAARQAHPERRLVAVFQPHLFSRTRDLATSFAAELSHADVVILLPVYPSREIPIPGVNSSLIRDAMASEVEVIEIDPADNLRFDLHRLTEPGDLVLTLGAGDVHRVAEIFLGVEEAI